MLSSSLNEIQHAALGQFHLSELTFLTSLHLSDFDSSSLFSSRSLHDVCSLCSASRMLRYLPSWEDYFEVFQAILHQPEQIFSRQWKNLLELDTCLNDIDKFGQRLRQQGFVSSSSLSPLRALTFSLFQSAWPVNARSAAKNSTPV